MELSISESYQANFQKEVNMELEVTWGRTVRVWWAYVWRLMLITSIIGFGLGLFMGVLGSPPQLANIILNLTGIISIAISFAVMQRILGKDFGEFRLVLIRKEVNTELEVTWGRTVRVWWAYLWRSMLITFIIGFVMGLLQAQGAFNSDLPIQLVGIIISLAFSLVVMKMILGKDFREFRLVLIRKDDKSPNKLGLESPNFPSPKPSSP